MAADFSGALNQGPVVDPERLNALYKLMVESVHHYAIIALDAEGHILSWNPGAENYKGYRKEEIVGKHFSVFYPPEEIAVGKPEYLLSVAAAEGRVEEEGWRVRKDGSRFWADVVITALRDPSGELVGYGKVTRDLTERKHAQERAIRDAERVAEAEAANRAKSDFLAALSHELRTPLNAIGGYLDLLIMGVRGPLSETQIEDLDRVRRSQQHLLGIINDLLNFTRVDAGKVSYASEPVPLAEVMESVHAMLLPQAAVKDIELTRDEPATRHCARADRAKVEQILINLVSNAVKYTHQGGRVRVSANGDAEMVRLSVADTGTGISQEDIETIFEPFVQVGRTFTSSHEGVGLGLAISRDLARAMGGSLTVTSTLGRGSTFTLALPRDPDGACAAPENPS